LNPNGAGKISEVPALNTEDAAREYRERLFPLYTQFTKKMKQLFKELITQLDISFTVEARPKDPEEFRKKIGRPEKHYVNPLAEVSDFCGVRVILHHIADTKKVMSLVEREFIVDPQYSHYKKDQLEVDRFGYLTEAQLVVTLRPDRRCLPEWQPFRDFKAEIQIRTIIQHAWDVISHDYDYKVEADIPKELRRRLFRLSALFELADEELDDFVGEVRKKIDAYKDSLAKGERKIEINVDSLRTYVVTSREVQYWNNFLKTDPDIGHRVETWGDLSRDVRMAEFCGLRSIEDLDSALRQARGWGEKFFKRYYAHYLAEHNVPRDRVTTVVNGVVNMLLVASFADKLDAKTLTKDFGYGSTTILDIAREVRYRYKLDSSTAG